MTTSTRNSLGIWLTVFWLCSLAFTQSGDSSSAIVPRLVNYSGKAVDSQGKTVVGVAGITFSIYKEQSEGVPLWMETQNVTADAKGNYTVQLGATKPEGLPLDLFSSGEARWLGVTVNSGQEQPRVLLLSVPYALKAADAETVGGLPASAFVLAAPPMAGTNSTTPSAGSGNASPAVSSDVTTTGGTVNAIPLFSAATNIQNSAVSQTGSGTTAKIGINTTAPTVALDVHGGTTVRGTLASPTSGTATAAAGKNSYPHDFVASVFNSSTSAAVNQTFQWQAEPAGNDTTTPSGTLNLLFGSGTATPAETGLKISNQGLITFASGQTFPGGTGSGTITGVTAGTALTGGGTSGSVTVNLDTTKVPLLAAANTFTGNQTMNGNLSATGMVSGSGFGIGSNLFDWGSYANANAFLGFAGNATSTGSYNTASGYAALQSVTTGIENTAIGYAALQGNTAAGANTAVGYGVLQSNSGTFNTAIGMEAMNSNSTGYQDTAIGVAALLANTTGYYNAATGLDALRFNTTGYANTASGYAALYSNTTACCNTAVGTQALVNSNVVSSPGGSPSNDAFGYQTLYSNTGGYENEAFGYQAMYSNTNGSFNSAFGNQAMYSSTGGSFNAAFGQGALPRISSGNSNTAVGGGSGSTMDGSPITGSDNTFLGAAAFMSTGSLSNATAVGACALVSASNAMSLGGDCGHGIANGGIDVENPSNILTVYQGGGHAIADGWDTYSSRRWKTNIHPLQDALSKVEQLRGVSYDLKATGKHEIGVIAEEVGAVVPEVVSFEDNGKDARGVDYSRLTALLIEAVKAQQKQIAAQAVQVRLLRSELKRRSVKEAALESRLQQLEQDRNERQVASAHSVASEATAQHAVRPGN